ncbi:MAG: hypothetical protein P9X24_09150 [Candidatus Hatepunaea meridiana]|nr:hypothetical protein [Candidatus Hatepunaea meridiana]
MPEWLNPIIPGLIGAVGIPLALYLFGLLLPRKRTFEWGYKVGCFLTKFGQKKLGASWGKIEDRFASTVADFVEGVYKGLDSDDAESKG